MQKEYHILMQGDKNCGAVSIDRIDEGIMIRVYIEEKEEFDLGGVFRVYMVSLKTKDIKYLGVLSGFKGEFLVKDICSPVGFAVTIKTTEGKESFFACCAQEGKFASVHDIFEGNYSKNETETEPKQKNNDAGIKKIWFKKEYRKRCEQKLEELLLGYTTEKINGYYIKEKCKILEYILSQQEVYERISKYGYYLFSYINNENEKTFVVSVPCAGEEKNPFKNCLEYTFEIVPDIEGDIGYFCVGAGEDEKGDFFCKKL